MNSETLAELDRLERMVDLRISDIPEQSANGLCERVAELLFEHARALIDAAKERDQLRTENEKLRALLRRVEHGGRRSDFSNDSYAVCPVCCHPEGEYEDYDVDADAIIITTNHHIGCELAAVLEGVGNAE